MRTFLAALIVLGFTNAHPSGYIYPKPARTFSYLSGKTLVSTSNGTASNFDCDHIQHTVGAEQAVTYHAENNSGNKFAARKEHDGQIHINQQQEKEHDEQFDSSLDDTVVIDTASESSTETEISASEEEHNIGIAVAVADANENKDRDLTVLELTTSKSDVRSTNSAAGLNSDEIESSTQQREYDTKDLKVDVDNYKNKDNVGIVTESISAESTITETPMNVSDDSISNSKSDTVSNTSKILNDASNAVSDGAETGTKLNGGNEYETSSTETRINKNTSSKSKGDKPEIAIIPRVPSKKTVTAQDKESGSQYARQPSSFFPIYFSSLPSARSSFESGGVVSIANSYSTGRGGIASSHATAYGSSRNSETNKC